MKILRLVVTIVLGSVILAGCSSASGSSTDQKNQDSQSTHNHNSASAKKSTDNNKKGHGSNHENGSTSNHDSAAYTQESDNSTKKSNENGSTNIADQLKMDDSNIKQPTDFPVKENIKAHISKNKPSVYSIDYKTELNKDIASFTGTLYKTTDAAKSDLDEFMNGKAVPKSKMGEKDLGH